MIDSFSLREMCDEFLRIRVEMATSEFPGRALCFGHDDLSARDGWSIVLADDDKPQQHEVAAFWYPCEGERARHASLYCHGTRLELLMGVLQTGQFRESVGDQHAIRGIQAVYATRISGWRRALNYAIGVPLFNEKYFIHPMWILRTAEGRVPGSGKNLQDIYPLSPTGLRVEGLMLFAVDMVAATTDNFGGTVRGAWDGRLELVLKPEPDVPMPQPPLPRPGNAPRISARTQCVETSVLTNDPVAPAGRS